MATKLPPSRVSLAPGRPGTRPKKVGDASIENESGGLAKLLDQYGCGPLQIVGSHSTNGVAAIHSGLLGSIMAADGGDCEEALARFGEAGVNVEALASQLQAEGAESFVKSWKELMAVIASKSQALQEVA